MASILARYQDENPALPVVGWQARIRRRGYPAQSRTFERKADAEAWARSVENEMDRGVFVSRAEAEATTLYDALGRYKKEVSAKKKGSEQEAYRIKALQALPLAKRTLAAIKGAQVAQLRDDELARGLAPSSVMKTLALLSHLFETARKEWGIEVDNPVKKISNPACISKEESKWLKKKRPPCRPISKTSSRPCARS